MEAETGLRLAAALTAEAPFTRALTAGWNPAGNPFRHDLAWSLNDIRVTKDGQDRGSLADRTTWPLAWPYAWLWNREREAYDLLFDPSKPGFGGVKSAVPLGAGMWVKAQQPGVALTFSPVGRTARSPGTSPGGSAGRTPPRPSPEEWAAELCVAMDGFQAGGHRFGVLAGTTPAGRCRPALT